MNDSKPWYLSRTIWLNVAAFAVAVVGLISEQPWIPPSALPVIAMVVSMANLYLRPNTTTKLTK